MPFITAQLNDRAQPMHRGEIYEDPLHEFLSERDLGEVTGGGTQFGEKREIAYCDIEVELKTVTAEILGLIASKLESLGAPIGSKLIHDEGELQFGLNEGLGVYLNGSDLDSEVYRASDVNHVYEEFNRLLGDEGAIHSYWQGPTETALYMYGSSFLRMKDALAGFMATYPLCQMARCEKIA